MMKTLPIALSLTAAFALPAFAQDDEERPRRGRPDRAAAASSDVAKGAPSVLAALDRNRDGKIDQHEIDMAVVALRRMDANEDGTISADEMVAPTGGRPGGPPPGSEGGDRPRRGTPNFAELDKDGDSKISKEEAPDRMKDRFDQMDQNGDGFLDKDEQDRIAQFIRERMGQRGGPGQQRDRRREPEGGQGETEKPKRPPVEE